MRARRDLRPQVVDQKNRHPQARPTRVAAGTPDPLMPRNHRRAPTAHGSSRRSLNSGASWHGRAGPSLRSFPVRRRGAPTPRPGRTDGDDEAPLRRLLDPQPLDVARHAGSTMSRRSATSRAACSTVACATGRARCAWSESASRASATFASSRSKRLNRLGKPRPRAESLHETLRGRSGRGGPIRGGTVEGFEESYDDHCGVGAVRGARRRSRPGQRDDLGPFDQEPLDSAEEAVAPHDPQAARPPGAARSAGAQGPTGAWGLAAVLQGPPGPSGPSGARGCFGSLGSARCFGSSGPPGVFGSFGSAGRFGSSGSPGSFGYRRVLQVLRVPEGDPGAGGSPDLHDERHASDGAASRHRDIHDAEHERPEHRDSERLGRVHLGRLVRLHHHDYTTVSAQASS